MLGSFLFAAAREAGASPLLNFEIASDCVLGTVKFLKTLAHEDAFKCVDAAAKSVCHVCVSLILMILMEPSPVLVGDRDHLRHLNTLPTACQAY